MWCYSELGEGTTFKVYLPRVDAPVDRLPVRAAARPARGSETILVVEDEAALREIIRKLPLADVVLPGGSGRLLADELLAQRADLKVLFMSGYTED